MNWRAIRAVVRRDLTLVRQSKAVMIPLVTVPLVLLVILPLVATLAPNYVNIPGLDDLDALLGQMPEDVRAGLAGAGDQERLVVLLTVYLFAPLFLLIPTMVANVIAADSFAGEKERKTLEALLYSPMTDREIVTAKLLAPWLAAMAVTFVGFVLYAIVVNAGAWPVMERIFFPTPMWLLLVLWVAPAVAALGLGGAVLVSLRVGTVQEAYQLGGLVVLPVVALMVSQATGLLFFTTTVVFVIGLLVWLLALGLLLIAVRSFDRPRLTVQA